MPNSSVKASPGGHNPKPLGVLNPSPSRRLAQQGEGTCACGHVLLLVSFRPLRVRRFLWLSLGLQPKVRLPMKQNVIKPRPPPPPHLPPPPPKKDHAEHITENGINRKTQKAQSAGWQKTWFQVVKNIARRPRFWSLGRSRNQKCTTKTDVTSVLVQETIKAEMRQHPRLRRPQHMQEGKILANDGVFQVREKQC